MGSLPWPLSQHWLDNACLNIDRGVRDHLDKLQVTAALDRIGEHQERAMSNLERLHSNVEAAVPGDRSRFDRPGPSVRPEAQLPRDLHRPACVVRPSSHDQ
jgi:hypothetical protein